MINVKQRQNRVKTLSNFSKSDHVVKQSQQKRAKIILKTISHKQILPNAQMVKRINVRHHRSQTSAAYNIALQNPYEKFVKQLNIVLPTPKQKFYEFMQIPPFNRSVHHIELIEHFLKQYKFFKNHPVQLLQQIAKKVRLCQQKQLQDKFIIVVESGECLFNKQRFLKGQILGRKQVCSSQISASPQTKFIVIYRHQYNFLVSCYLQKQKGTFRNFLSTLQIFKMFSKKAFDKFMDNLTLNYFCEGQQLYRFGQQANHLFIVYQGKAVRRVIIEIDKTNKIPMLKYSKIVKILSKSYEHKIQFQKQDLIGISQVIDHIQTRKQNITLLQNSIILGLDKHILRQNLDQYIVDRLRKYNIKKYPVTYDKLCQKYQKQMTSAKQQQQRKIEALKQTINGSISEKKTEKINSIIKKYQQNIKKSEIVNLLECKIQQRRVQRQ